MGSERSAFVWWSGARGRFTGRSSPTAFRCLAKSDRRAALSRFGCAFQQARSTSCPEESGIAFLTARSLQRGSGGRSFEEINTRLDELGGSITVDAGREFVEARVRGLRDDFPELVEMLAHALQRPDFPAVEVDKVRSEQLGAIAEADNDTRATADRLLRRSVYPEPNPFGRRVLGSSEIVATLDRDAVAAYHARAFSPSGATIAVVGGIGEFDACGRDTFVRIQLLGRFPASGRSRESARQQ